MERAANAPTIADVRAGIRAEQRKRVAVDANGYAREYWQQSSEYRAVVSVAEHVKAHGPGRPSGDV